MRNNNTKMFRKKIDPVLKQKVNKAHSPISARKNNRISSAKRPAISKRLHLGARSPPKYSKFGARNRELICVNVTTQRGNIKVVVRVRPPSTKEAAVAFTTIVKAIDSNMIIFDPLEDENEFYYHGVKQTGRNMLVKPKKNIKFAFDRVYGPDSENCGIFKETIEPIIDHVLNGFNCSVFAYGSTGAGKTYTMLGSEDNPGMTFLTVMELYRRLEEKQAEYETEIIVSYLEVYNEAVRDLLNKSGVLTIREDAKGGVTVPNISFHRPADASQLMSMLSYGNSVRSQHPTDHNAESSRSHAVFQVMVTLRERYVKDTASTVKKAKLVMVDLAGSERGSATGFKGQQFREGASINRSLLALANCINALADGKRHIPYRDSKLTRILKDSLGGNCHTIMIANVSPSKLSYDDSYNTLTYANRAKNIKCQVKKNVVSVDACVAKYAKTIEEMRQEIASLQEQNCEKDRIILALEVDAIVDSNPITRPDSGKNKIMNDHMAVTDKRLEVERELNKHSVSNALAQFKIQLKRRRIESLKNLTSFDISCRKAIEKLDKHIENEKVVIDETEESMQSNEKELAALKVTLSDMRKSLTEADETNRTDAFGNVAAIQLYLDLCENQKIGDNASVYANATQTLVEFTLQQESILGKAMECLMRTHILYSQTKMEPQSLAKLYKEVVGEFCRTRVNWSSDVDEEQAIKDEEEFSHPSIPLMKSAAKNFYEDNATADVQMEDFDENEENKGDETFNIEFTATSTRLAGSSPKL